MTPRTLAALAVTPIMIAGTTVGITTLSAAPASAASCLPGVHVAGTSAKASGKPRVTSTKPALVRKGSKKHPRWVAQQTVTATYGTVTVTVSDTVCTGDDADRALSWSYSGSANGQSSAGVHAKGKTKAKAKAALKKAAARAKKKVTTQVKKQGAASARTAATNAAVAQTTGLSHVVYYSLSDAATVASATPTATGMTIRPAANGGLTLSIPAGYDDSGNAACISKASTWPSSYYIVDAGFSIPGVSLAGGAPVGFNPQSALVAAVAAAGDDDDLLPWVYAGGFSTHDDGGFDDPRWRYGWSDEGAGIAGFGGFDDATATSGDMVCFGAGNMPAGTVTIPQFRVASDYRATDGGTVKVDLVNPVTVKVG